MVGEIVEAMQITTKTEDNMKFVYTAKMEGYANVSSDMKELSEIAICPRVMKSFK